METGKIDELMAMTKDYLDGKLDVITYTQDFPFEVERYFKDMMKEDPIMGKLIKDCLIEDGIHLYDKLPEEDFKNEIYDQYSYLMSVRNQK